MLFRSPAPSDAGTLRLRQEAPQQVQQRWWLKHVWLRPAYRSQGIFRHSVPYLNTWHPGFLVRDPWPVLARALKQHPGHVFAGDVQWF